MVLVFTSVKHCSKSISLCFSEINGIKKETIAVKIGGVPPVCRGEKAADVPWP
jgi:hypothetical protein